MIPASSLYGGIIIGIIFVIIGVPIFITNCGFLRKKCDGPIKFIGNITDYDMVEYQCGNKCTLYTKCGSEYSDCYNCVSYEPVYCHKIIAQVVYNYTKICQYSEIYSNKTKIHNGSIIDVYATDKKCSFETYYNYHDHSFVGFILMTTGIVAIFVHSIPFFIPMFKQHIQMTNIINPIGIV